MGGSRQGRERWALLGQAGCLGPSGVRGLGSSGLRVRPKGQSAYSRPWAGAADDGEDAVDDGDADGNVDGTEESRPWP